MKTQTCIAIALFLACAHPVLADDPRPETKLEALPDADAGSAATGSGSKVAVEAGEDGAKVKLRVASNAISLSGPNYLRFAFGAEAPFDKDTQQEADLGSLSGLSSGTKASFEASWLYWPSPTDDEIKEIQTLCETQLAALIPNFRWLDEERPKLSLFLFTPRTCHEDLFAEAEIQSIATKLRAAVEEFATFSGFTAGQARDKAGVGR